MRIRDEFIIKDTGILQEIFLRNVYRLPDRFAASDHIIDVGAHIGAFALACWLRGSRNIEAVEPEAWNFDLLWTNVSDVCGGVRVLQRAVWRSGEPSVELGITLDPINPAGHSVARGGGGLQTAATIGLDDLISGPVAFLKIDAESSEYPILVTSKKLGLVKRLAVEYHTEPLREEAGVQADLNKLLDVLCCAGFKVEVSDKFHHDIYERGVIHASR